MVGAVGDTPRWHYFQMYPTSHQHLCWQTLVCLPNDFPFAPYYLILHIFRVIVMQNSDQTSLLQKTLPWLPTAIRINTKPLVRTSKSHVHWSQPAFLLPLHPLSSPLCSFHSGLLSMSHTCQLHSIPGPLHLLVPLFRRPLDLFCVLSSSVTKVILAAILFPTPLFYFLMVLTIWIFIITFFICVFPSNVISKKAETLTSSLLHPCAQHIIADKQQITGANERTVSRRVIVRMHPYLILRVLENLFCCSVK